jgi:hypothetical protein
MQQIGITNFSFVSSLTKTPAIIAPDHYLRRPGLENHASLIATNIDILRNFDRHDAFLVFEDDVTIANDLSTFSLRELPESWSFVQLNWCAEKCIAHMKQPMAGVISSSGAACTGAMLYSKQGARKLLQAFTKEGGMQDVRGGIDRWIRAAHVGGGYIHYPMLFRQDSWNFGSGWWE